MMNAFLSIFGPDIVFECLEFVHIIGELIVYFANLECQLWHRIEADHECEQR